MALDTHVAVNHFKLSFALETQHERIFRLSIFRDRRVELRQTLQTRQLVQHKPDRVLAFLGFVQQAQNEKIDPQTMERAQRFALTGLRGQKDPAAPIL
jgi:hypothetical protein